MSGNPSNDGGKPQHKGNKQKGKPHHQRKNVTGGGHQQKGNEQNAKGHKQRNDTTGIPAPTVNPVSEVTDSSALISWDSVDNVNEYQVWWRPLNESATREKDVTGGINSIRLNNLLPNRQYGVTVSSVSMGVVVNTSDEVQFTTNPTSLNQSTVSMVTHNEFSVKWKQNQHNTSPLKQQQQVSQILSSQQHQPNQHFPQWGPVNLAELRVKGNQDQLHAITQPQLLPQLSFPQQLTQEELPVKSYESSCHQCENVARDLKVVLQVVQNIDRKIDQPHHKESRSKTERNKRDREGSGNKSIISNICSSAVGWLGKSERDDDHEDQQTTSDETHTMAMQKEIQRLQQENKIMDMQLKRLGKGNMEYLQATGNSKEAKGQTNPRDEFVGLRNKLLNFIDLLPLEDDDSDLSKSLCNSFLSTKTAEDAVEIILAESLQVAYDAGKEKILDLLKKICHQKCHDCSLTNTASKENFISILMSETQKRPERDKMIEEVFSLLHSERKQDMAHIANFQLFYQNEVANNILVKHDTIEEINQNFRSAVIKALKSFKIDHDNYQQDICEKASNTAEVVWRLITLPDPMLLHLKSTEQLKKDEELFNSEKFKLHSNTKTRIKAKEDDYEIDAYAYPRLTNSCGGKIIEVAIVFVRKRK